VSKLALRSKLERGKMTEARLRIGIIGIGWYAAGAVVPQLQKTDRVEIAALARRNPERLALAQRALNVSEVYTDWREMLDCAVLDAVAVCTPNNAHVEPALAALERGLHVFVEKPLALASEDAQRMIATAAQAERVLTVGYNARGMGSWRTIKRLLDEGAIGPVRQVTVAACIDARLLWQEMQPEALPSSELIRTFFRDALHPSSYRSRPDEIGGGMFVDVGTHLLDLMLWLADGLPVQVMAFSQQAGGGKGSVINAQVRLDSGAILSITFNDAVSGGDEFKFYGQGGMTLYGDRGWIRADWSGYMATEAQQIWIERDGVQEQVAPAFETLHPAAAFVATVLDGASNLCPAHEAARAVILTEAAYRSMETGHVIQVESV
jgi:predicted dehydrogenase